MTLAQFVIAVLLGALVWAVGAIFDNTPGNTKARNAGLVVFAVAVAAALLGLWNI